jgi:hypothetical protein
MTLEELMQGAAQESIDTREAHVIMFTEGLNGYVCPNEGVLAESRAVFKGTYRDCQIWVERQGISSALRYVVAHRAELSGGELMAADCLELISRLPANRSGS